MQSSPLTEEINAHVPHDGYHKTGEQRLIWCHTSSDRLVELLDVTLLFVTLFQTQIGHAPIGGTPVFQQWHPHLPDCLNS